MATTNERTRTEKKFEFEITHSDVVEMMNDPEVLLNGGDVSAEQVFSLVLRKNNGSEILLRDMKPEDTLIFKFNIVTVENDSENLGGIDITT